MSNRARFGRLARSVLQKSWVGLEFETRKSFRPAPFSLQARRARGGLGRASPRASAFLIKKNRLWTLKWPRCTLAIQMAQAHASQTRPSQPLELNLISHSLESLLLSPLSQDPHPQPWALTLLFRFQTPSTSGLRLDFESLTLSPSQPPSTTAASRQPHSHGLPLSQDSHLRPRALEPSPFSFDFEPQHQPHVFDWTSSLTLNPSRPPFVALRYPHPPPHTKHLSLRLCVSVPPLISFSTL